ncbi:MAG: peptidylprolyl isomerase [Nitrospinales bacterium]
MSLSKSIQFPIQLFIVVILLFAPMQNVFAHGGGHGNELAISLPDVVAKVNGNDIKKDSIEKALGRIVHNASDNGKKLSPDQQKSTAKKLIDDEINNVLLLQKAQELGIKVSSEDAMKARKHVNILRIEAVLEKEIGSKIKVPEAEIKSFYEKNKNQFMEKEKVRASVILIKVNKKRGAAGEQDAKNNIMKLVKKIEDGADFELVAKESSQDSLASRGGDLGFFAKDSRIPEIFKKQAFSLEVGKVSEVFSTRHGLHLMKVTEKKAGGVMPLEKANERIENALKLNEIKKRVPSYITTMRKNAKVQTYF